MMQLSSGPIALIKYFTSSNLGLWLDLIKHTVSNNILILRKARLFPECMAFYRYHKEILITGLL